MIAGVTVGWTRAPCAPRSGHRFLAELLAQLTPDDTRIVSVCASCGSTEHGRPRAASGKAVLSLSYAQPYVMAAVAPASIGRGIGVDIAVRHTTGPIPDLAALFDPLPAPTVREWTAIEAAVKADGRGLRIAPNEVQLSALTALAGVAEPAGVATLPGRATRISLWALPSPPGCIATLAIDPGDACNDDTS